MILPSDAAELWSLDHEKLWKSEMFEYLDHFKEFHDV